MRDIGTVQIMASFVLRLGRVSVVAVSVISMLQLINDPPAMWVPIVGFIDPTDEQSKKLADVSNPVLPLIATAILSYAVSSYCFTVYSMAVDTILICYCEDKNINDGKTGYFASGDLQAYFQDKAPKYAFRYFTQEPDDEGVGWHDKSRVEIEQVPGTWASGGVRKMSEAISRDAQHLREARVQSPQVGTIMPDERHRPAGNRDEQNAAI